MREGDICCNNYYVANRSFPSEVRNDEKGGVWGDPGGRETFRDR